MPERPLKMSPDKNRLITNLKLAVIALAATMAGCETMSNLNPFDDDEDDMPPPVASSSSSSTVYSASSTGTSAPPAQQQSRMVLVEQAVPLAAGAPDEYIVQVGDTLWDIANTFLRDPWYWPEVWYVNPQVENPHLIYPGDVLALVTIDGQQRITTVRLADGAGNTADRGSHQHPLRTDRIISVERHGA
jgi:LysM repeat protein